MCTGLQATKEHSAKIANICNKNIYLCMKIVRVKEFLHIHTQLNFDNDVIINVLCQAFSG